ncbi:MAG TPA: hypothetical protein DIU37_04860 [Opitutae bacterium]|nr:hypothetical protein [Opitutae bacterium]
MYVQAPKEKGTPMHQRSATPSSRKGFYTLVATLSLTLNIAQAHVAFFDTQPRNGLVQTYLDQYAYATTQDYFVRAMECHPGLIERTGIYIDTLAASRGSKKSRKAFAHESFKLGNAYRMLNAGLLDLIYERYYLILPLAPLSKPYQDYMKLVFVLSWSMVQLIEAFDDKLSDLTFETFRSSSNPQVIVWWHQHLNRAKHALTWFQISLTLLKEGIVVEVPGIDTLFEDTLNTEQLPWPFSYLSYKPMVMVKRITSFSNKFYGFAESD